MGLIGREIEETIYRWRESCTRCRVAASEVCRICADVCPGFSNHTFDDQHSNVRICRKYAQLSIALSLEAALI